jgi:hypothetical protein
MTAELRIVIISILYLVNVMWQDTVIEPKPRHLEKIVFDSSRRKLILFGGVEFNDGKIATPENLFVWNGSSWNEQIATGPGHRLSPGMAFDEKEKIIFLVGGVQLKDGKEIVKPDVWTWDDAKWKFINSDCPIKSCKLVYDNVKQRMLVHGDAHNITENWKGGDPQRFELWELKNNHWKKLSSEGPQPSSSYEIIYHKKRNSMIIPSWEKGVLSLWEWRNETWRKMQSVGESPTERSRYAMAYDEKQESIFFFGGRDNSDQLINDFWKWNEGKWTKIEGTELPSGRTSAHMEYGEGELVLYGGTTATGISNELWEYKNGEWKLFKSVRGK